MEAIASELERLHILFAAGSDVLDESALANTASVATKFQALGNAASGNRYDVTLQVVGRADPTGAETDNLALSRRRAIAVRDRLASLGIPATRLTIEATGSNDPLSADSPAERARVNRSASFVIQAQPSRGTTSVERAR
jgi:outer membrane protein OmpA-like peptidoglycan-associated protein